MHQLTKYGKCYPYLIQLVTKKAIILVAEYAISLEIFAR